MPSTAIPAWAHRHGANLPPRSRRWQDKAVLLDMRAPRFQTRDLRWSLAFRGLLLDLKGPFEPHEIVGRFADGDISSGTVAACMPDRVPRSRSNRGQHDAGDRGAGRLQPGWP